MACVLTLGVSPATDVAGVVGHEGLVQAVGQTHGGIVGAGLQWAVQLEQGDVIGPGSRVDEFGMLEQHRKCLRNKLHYDNIHDAST